jgi:hypothetical protein
MVRKYVKGPLHNLENTLNHKTEVKYLMREIKLITFRGSMAICVLESMLFFLNLKLLFDF